MHSIDKIMIDIITVNKPSNVLFLKLILKEVYLILHNKDSSFRTNYDLSAHVVNYLLKLTMTIESWKQVNGSFDKLGLNK